MTVGGSARYVGENAYFRYNAQRLQPRASAPVAQLHGAWIGDSLSRAQSVLMTP
jgi:hypothetical protein